MSEQGNASAAFWEDIDPEGALRRSRALVDAIDDGIVHLDATGRIAAVNDVVVERLGHARDDLVGEHVSSLLNDASVDRLEATIDDLVDEPERVATIDASVRTAAGGTAERELRINPIVADGERQGTVVVARAITGQSDQRTVDSDSVDLAGTTTGPREHERAILNQVFEASPIAISALRPDGEVVAINDRAAEVFGSDREIAPETYDSGEWRLYDESGDLIPEDERAFAQVVETGEQVTNFEAQVEWEDDSRRWLSFDAAPVFDSDGELSIVVLTFEDITERKGVEQQKTELETELSEVLGRISDAFFALDEEYQFTHINDRAHELINPRGEELLGENIWEQFPAAAERRFKQKYEHAMEAQETVSFEEYYPDPLDTWFEVRAYPSETGLSVYFRDVTKRKERERRYRALAENFPNGIVTLFDDDLMYTLASGQAFDTLPVDADDLEGNHVRDVWNEETTNALEPALQATLDGERRAIELEYVDREWVVYTIPISDEEGNVFAGMTMAQDITEQKEHERELRDAKDKLEDHKKQLEAAVEAGAIGTWEWHIPDDTFVAGASLARKFGVDPAEAREGVSLNRLVDAIHEDDVDQVEAEIQEAVETCGEYEAEYRVWNADGELRWVVARGHVECDEDGNPVTFPGALIDITERKQTERELEESERRYRTMAEHFPNGIVTLFDTDREYTLAAGQGFENVALDTDDVQGSSVSEVWDADTAEALEPVFEAALDGEERTIEITYADREWVVHGAPITDEDGDVFAGITMARDITERKEHEEELAKYETIVETINDGIYVTDEDGRYTMVNDAYTDMTGYSHEELIGEHASLVVAEDTLEKAGQIREAMANGEVSNPTMEATVETADGERVPVEAAFATLPTADHEERVGVVRDITKRKEQRQKIEESERRYRTLVENFPNGAVGLFDDDLRYTAVGGHLVDSREIGPEDRIGGRITELYPDDLIEDIEPYFEAALDGKTNSFELEFRDRYLSAYTLPIEDADGNVDAGMLVVQDLTDRKEMEQELRESEAKFRMLAENLEEVVWMSTPDQSEMIYINPMYEEIWGQDREKLYDDSMAFTEAIHPDDQERVEDAYRRLPDDEYDEEFRVVQPDGEIRWVHSRAAPVQNDRGEVFRIVGIAEDVTERKEREQALEKSERRYRTLAEHFPNGAVGVYNHDLEYTLAEGAMLGERLPDSEQLEESRMPDIFPESTAADLEPLFRAAVEDGETGSTTTELGDHVWQVWATPLKDADGAIFSGLSFAQDITEQVEREQRLEELVERLEESNERLEQFAYAASHDLQEPLRMVSSYLSLIERRYEDELDEEGKEFLDFAVDGAERMREMIDALLEYSRVETRGDPLEPVELDDVMADAQTDLQMKIEETNAEVTVESLPRVVGDEEQLRRVFQNLLDNALEYSGDEPPAVHVSAERDGNQWVLSVQDDGIGIEPEQTDSVFEVFQRLHTQEEHTGTGIGLALCRRIVERHDGEIWVESEPGRGSTFKFTLPIVEARND